MIKGCCTFWQWPFVWKNIGKECGLCQMKKLHLLRQELLEEIIKMLYVFGLRDREMLQRSLRKDLFQSVKL